MRYLGLDVGDKTIDSSLFLLLLANGRPIGAGDTRPTERLAKSFIERGRLDLDDAPEVDPPFVRVAGAHRVSIYPALSAVLASPIFAVGRLSLSFPWRSGPSYLRLSPRMLVKKLDKTV